MNEPKSSRYHRLRRRGAYGAAAVAAGLLAALTFGGGSLLLRDLTGGSPAAFAAVLALLYQAAAAPFAFRRHALEREYGQSRARAGAWVRDYAKGGALVVAGSAAGAELVYAAIREWPRWWWAAAGAGGTAFAALMTGIAPVLILPLFHRPRPVGREALRRRIADLSARSGVGLPDVVQVGAAGGPPRASAALVGAGPTRRILLSDTIVGDYTDDEIEVVLAHELGHHAHRDLTKALGAEGAVLLAGFGAAAAVLQLAWRPFGLTGPADPAGLPLVVLALGGVAVVAAPFRNALARRSERRADEFALAHASRPAAFIDAMRRMAAQNMAEERPSKPALWMFHAHPTVEERIAAAREKLRGQ